MAESDYCDDYYDYMNDDCDGDCDDCNHKDCDEHPHQKYLHRYSTLANHAKILAIGDGNRNLRKRIWNTKN